MYLRAKAVRHHLDAVEKRPHALEENRILIHPEQ
jgi:hypothetical protein